MAYALHKNLPANALGRDFTIGDVHGCVDLVERALERVKFDPSRDRLFPVGDLIDRGPDSARSAKLLLHDFVHSVPGNHERMLIDIYADGEPYPNALAYYCRHNGLDWWLDTKDEVRQDVLDLIRPLPFTIETLTCRGSVGFVHAEVPSGMDWQTFLQKIESGDAHVREQAVWGRTRADRGDTSGVAGIDRLFVGHTVMDGPVRQGNVYYIDTGAVFGVVNYPALKGGAWNRKDPSQVDQGKR